MTAAPIPAQPAPAQPPAAQPAPAQSIPAQSIPARLAAACSEIRLAGQADAVSGCQPSYVAAPASTAEASALLRTAAELGLAVLPRGAGTRLHWGTPPQRCDLVVDTRRMNQVLEHAAGDLVVRVQAGTGLRELGAVLAAAGQRLALDPPASAGPGGDGPASAGPGGDGDSGEDGRAAGGTVGGMIATGVAGPLRLHYGAPRDLLIGLTVIRADGAVTKSGGKVVKNVAGYDLGKLYAGSYGTLGLITEAVFRLHPVPKAVAYLTVDCADAATAAAAIAAAADSPLAPSAAELEWPDRGAPVSVAVLLEGDTGGVAERAGRLRALLGGAQTGAAVSTEPPSWWGVAAGEDRGETSIGTDPADRGTPSPSRSGPSGSGAAAAGEDGTVVRVAFWAGDLAAVLTGIGAAAATAGLDPAVRGSAAAGVLHVWLPGSAAAGAVAGFVTALRTALSRTAVTTAAAGGGRPAAAAAGTGSGTGSGGPPPRGSAVVLHAPAAVRAAVDIWGPVPSLTLMQAVKDQFDPGHRMAPGRFAGGI